MPPEPIARSALSIDLSPRFVATTTVAASPAAAVETVIATAPTIAANCAVTTAVDLEGWAAFTAGTAGVSARLRIRQTNVSGTVVADSGLVTVAAASLYSLLVAGLDTGAVIPGQVYVLTLTVGSATAASTVSACKLRALVV